MKFNFRKIASVLACTAMLGSTIGLAAAVDNYPQPFVASGVADVAVVYGSQMDYAAALVIGSSLSAGIVTTGATATDSTVEGGDYVLLAKSSDKVNLGNNVATVFGSSVTDDHLKTLLADGTYANDEGTTYKYEQKVTLGNNLIVSYFANSDYEDRTPTIGINLSSSQHVLNYTLDFTTDAESDVDASGNMLDIETTMIKMMGKEYYILDAKNGSTESLTLLDAANKQVVKEGETITVNTGAKTYSVTATWVSPTEAQLTIDGVATNSLSEGGTQKLPDGSWLSITDIMARDVAGVVGQVEFSIGTGKIEIIDGSAIEINDVSVSEVTGYTTMTASGTKAKLDKIVLSWSTDDNEFITPGTSLSIPGFGNIKLSMKDFVIPAEEVTQVLPVGSGANGHVDIKTTIKDGGITLPILYVNASGEITGLGESANERLVTSATASSVVYNYTKGDRYMIATWNSTSDAESYMIRFSGFLNSTTSANTVDVDRYANGGWTTVCDDKKATDSCNLGSLSVTIDAVSAVGSYKTVTVTGNAGSSFRDLYTEEGLHIILPVDVTNAGTQGALGNINLSSSTAGYGYDSFFIGFREENKDDNLGQGSVFNVTVNDQTDGDVEISDITAGQELTDPDNSNHIYSRVVSDLATLVELEGDSSAQKEATITYSGSEAYAEVYLTDTSATVVGPSTIMPVLASEIGSTTTKNLIVVGGSCVNTVAATLLGSSTPLCGSDFTAATGVGAGKYLIQTFASPYSTGKVATLVAGYELDDTKNAANALTTKKPEITAGKKFTGSTAADLAAA